MNVYVEKKRFLNRYRRTYLLLVYHVELQGTGIKVAVMTIGDPLIYISLSRTQKQTFFQVYLPSMIFIAVSWVSFMIKLDIVPGRTALLVTMLLVLINVFNDVKAT